MLSKNWLANEITGSLDDRSKSFLGTFLLKCETVHLQNSLMCSNVFLVDSSKLSRNLKVYLVQMSSLNYDHQEKAL